MNLKIGDKIKCKKDFTSRITSNIIFSKGDYYLINDIENKYDRISISQLNGDYRISFKREEPIEESHIAHFLIFDYFYTDKELRKLKIEKLLNNE